MVRENTKKRYVRILRLGINIFGVGDRVHSQQHKYEKNNFGLIDYDEKKMLNEIGKVFYVDAPVDFEVFALIFNKIN